MATRQQRINAFIHEGDPPADQPLELLCEDHVGTYVIPFLCRLSSGVWRSVDAGERIEATVIGSLQNQGVMTIYYSSSFGRTTWPRREYRA
jgi:hypothetical protein